MHNARTAHFTEEDGSRISYVSRFRCACTDSIGDSVCARCTTRFPRCFALGVGGCDGFADVADGSCEGMVAVSVAGVVSHSMSLMNSSILARDSRVRAMISRALCDSLFGCFACFFFIAASVRCLRTGSGTCTESTAMRQATRRFHRGVARPVPYPLQAESPLRSLVRKPDT